jgi:biopolymer transport protein ExbD
MIPLIDISMVLLVFFMMTAQELLTASPIPSPTAANCLAISNTGVLHIGMGDAPGGKIEYFLKQDYKTPLTEQNALKIIEDDFRVVARSQIKVIITASGKLPYERVQDLTLALERMAGPDLQIQAKVIQRSRPSGEAGAEGGPE